MPQGLVAYSPGGVEYGNTTRQIGRVFGARAVQRNQQSFTITDARFGQATPYFFFLGDGYEVTISVSGNVLSFSRTGGTVSSTQVWGYLYYGTYA